MARARFPVLALASIFLACSRSKPLPPAGLALEIGFENTCEPSVGPELARKRPAAEISFSAGIEGRQALETTAGAVRIDPIRGSRVELERHRGLARGEGRSES